MMLLLMKLECASPVTKLFEFVREMVQNFSFRQKIWVRTGGYLCFGLQCDQMEWPAYSPDLNHLNFFWSILKQLLQKKQVYLLKMVHQYDQKAFLFLANDVFSDGNYRIFQISVMNKKFEFGKAVAYVLGCNAIRWNGRHTAQIWII